MQSLKKEYRDYSALDLCTLCVRIALDTKAEDLVVLDVHELSSFTDYFIIMTGRSTRHVLGLAEAIEDELRSKRINRRHAEGIQEGTWVLLDFGVLVVHVFYKDTRAFYQLEELWHDAPQLSLQDLGIQEEGGA
jgi:ribosome-associated protein